MKFNIKNGMIFGSLIVLLMLSEANLSHAEIKYDAKAHIFMDTGFPHGEGPLSKFYQTMEVLRKSYIMEGRVTEQRIELLNKKLAELNARIRLKQTKMTDYFKRIENPPKGVQCRPESSAARSDAQAISLHSLASEIAAIDGGGSEVAPFEHFDLYQSPDWIEKMLNGNYSPDAKPALVDETAKLLEIKQRLIGEITLNKTQDEKVIQKQVDLEKMQEIFNSSLHLNTLIPGAVKFSRYTYDYGNNNEGMIVHYGVDENSVRAHFPKGDEPEKVRLQKQLGSLGKLVSAAGVFDHEVVQKLSQYYGLSFNLNKEGNPVNTKLPAMAAADLEERMKSGLKYQFMKTLEAYQEQLAKEAAKVSAASAN